MLSSAQIAELKENIRDSEQRIKELEARMRTGEYVFHAMSEIAR